MFEVVHGIRKHGIKAAYTPPVSPLQDYPLL
jgi:hypothetical protein